MAGSNKMYFAVKIILPRVSEKKAFANGKLHTAATNVTRDSATLATSVTIDSDSLAMNITADTPTTEGLTLAAAATNMKGERGMCMGVEGHLGASFLELNSKENAACKNLAEAEKLIVRKHKAWLVNAYDWFVTTISVPAGAAQPSKATKAAKGKPAAKAGKKKKSK